jgi:hypothetical protein
MFIGAINSTVRKFLANTARVFEGQTVVVGCSGNFTSEAVISQYANPAAIHANDVSFYSCMAGRWLTGQPLEFTIVEAEYEWLTPYLESDTRRLAAILTLLDMLEFEKRNNAHRVRLWNLYRQTFGDLVDRTVERLSQVETRLTSFYAGDVFEHFQRFEAEAGAIFCCYAPTYVGGYEKLYQQLERIVQWDAPSYEMLDEAGRDRLLAWLTERRFLWYDDRLIEGLSPVMEQRAGRRRTVYLYSNVIEQPAYFDDRQVAGLPPLPLAGAEFEIKADSSVTLQRIKTTDLSKFKDAFLGKNIDHSQGMWGFAVVVAGRVVGFIEFSQAQYDRGSVYLLSDFAVPGTRYKRLSKLMVMLAKAGQTRRLAERSRQLRTTEVVTTAFSDRPVSMQYRGVLDLHTRGETKEGQKFLNYGASFADCSWQEVLAEWMKKHSKKR